MLMFSAVIYIPVYAQGVLGVGATGSGLILMPLMLGFVVMGIVAGRRITHTGRYKTLMLGGIVVMGLGVALLVRLGAESRALELTAAMVVLGIGMGMVSQQYVLVIQNDSARRDLGVATASSQFFRNVGSTVGTVMSAGLSTAIAGHLTPEAAAAMPPEGIDAGSVIDPEALTHLPDAVAQAVRAGLADQLHQVFLLMIPLILVQFVAMALLPADPLRTTLEDAEPGAAEEQRD